MFFTCPKCGAGINRHDYIDGFVCDSNVAGKMCDYRSNGVVFSTPLPPGTFGIEFFRKLIILSNSSQESTINPPDA